MRPLHEPLHERSARRRELARVCLACAICYLCGRAIVATWRPGDAPAAPVVPTLAAVFYINLDRSGVRRAHMESMLSEAGLATAPTRWRGNDGAAVSPEELEAWVASFPPFDSIRRGVKRFHRTRAEDEHAQRGTWGTRTSHLDVVRHLNRTGAPGELYLVLEDDVGLPGPDFEAVVRGIVAEAPADWDVLRLSCTWIEQTDPALLERVAATDGHATVRLVQLSDGDLRACRRRNADPTPACWFAGGAHAVLYRHDHLRRLLDRLIGDASDFDVALSQTFSYDRLSAGSAGVGLAPAAPDCAECLRSYCVQVDGITVGAYGSDRTG